MFDSIEMDEVGTQGQGGREGEEQKSDRNQPRRDDQQSEKQRSNRQEEQDGQQKRPGQEEEEN